MNPVAELRAAAQKVRDTASAATPGPWRVVVHHRRPHPTVPAQAELHTPERHFRVSMKCPRGLADAYWRALMHPGVAEPIAAWMDGAAKDLAAALGAYPFADEEADLDDLIGLCDEPDSVRRALTLARVILGHAAETDETGGR